MKIGASWLKPRNPVHFRITAASTHRERGGLYEQPGGQKNFSRLATNSKQLLHFYCCTGLSLTLEPPTPAAESMGRQRRILQGTVPPSLSLPLTLDGWITKVLCKKGLLISSGTGDFSNLEATQHPAEKRKSCRWRCKLQALAAG